MKTKEEIAAFVLDFLKYACARYADGAVVECLVMKSLWREQIDYFEAVVDLDAGNAYAELKHGQHGLIMVSYSSKR
ncbi:hypothetical protein COY25_00205 [Candidatus Uhrbacteria bacterium CG_4_10_14_0_2_um_filter_41_7]|uniref:Uncharacterized protein n=1 Tax=Candidatus Uhrbacteria bacterium CG_4_9_14_3_um_filter_41_35 TaxID=1975034 RepID=A0A2M7XGC4_9BACT|nr:MAG: hypothetical protein COV92_01615 [Candidatus Uhrbacteria bacterium CG11_big_fil_rev_8_21_14_0_20_41_9]PIZ55811.1 MAG: hypothetical protein COY25_00205 [Candidatus Uhrbacteria bacterium CG_4_10_14_0_2_um_filter_41_7]PJA46921.1 MAG: hypothetical protein CO173_00835 [Candidatus Uhrbacteria bacterium CG_4_9_14_3_um_filter_41_35]